MEIPQIVLDALDQAPELKQMIVEEIKVRITRLHTLGMTNAGIVEATGLGKRAGRPLGARTRRNESEN